MESWKSVAEALENGAMDPRTRVRWRKQDPSHQPYLEGEARVIAAQAGFTGHTSTRAMLAMMQLVSNSPSVFDFSVLEKPRYAPSASLGKALHLRVGHLSESDKQAQNFVRAWASVDREVFVDMHLKKILRYVDSKRKVTIPALELFQLLRSWDYRQKDILSAVSTEYFYAKSLSKPKSDSTTTNQS